MSNHITVDVHQLKDFTEEEQAKFRVMLVKLELLLNSEEFHARFLAFKFDDQTLGLSNQEIYEMLMSGADKLNKASDHDIDVYLTIYYSFKNTVGYTYPTSIFTWINRKYFSKFDHGEVAGNVIHEYMHKLGFSHRKATDYKSVPYGTGYLIRDMIKEFDKLGYFLMPDGKRLVVETTESGTVVTLPSEDVTVITEPVKVPEPQPAEEPTTTPVVEPKPVSEPVKVTYRKPWWSFLLFWK